MQSSPVNHHNTDPVLVFLTGKFPRLATHSLHIDPQWLSDLSVFIEGVLCKCTPASIWLQYLNVTGISHGQQTEQSLFWLLLLGLEMQATSWDPRMLPWDWPQRPLWLAEKGGESPQKWWHVTRELCMLDLYPRRKTWNNCIPLSTFASMVKPSREEAHRFLHAH